MRLLHELVRSVCFQGQRLFQGLVPRFVYSSNLPVGVHILGSGVLLAAAAGPHGRRHSALWYQSERVASQGPCAGELPTGERLVLPTAVQMVPSQADRRVRVLPRRGEPERGDQRRHGPQGQRAPERFLLLAVFRFVVSEPVRPLLLHEPALDCVLRDWNPLPRLGVRGDPHQMVPDQFQYYPRQNQPEPREDAARAGVPADHEAAHVDVGGLRDVRRVQARRVRQE
mmetsp:Transcript_41130/g.109783  ORF Transcript_41130/g.109783 Transcript_41130/m.109783 type:complete len:227 (+) Transcript_41130:240-920(+)